jgi:hypothetical protein
MAVTDESRAEHDKLDHGASAQEGWSVFECDGSANGSYQLQAWDLANVFPNDLAVWKHVYAHQHEPVPAAALAFLKKYSPSEYHRVITEGRT